MHLGALLGQDLPDFTRERTLTANQTIEVNAFGMNFLRQEGATPEERRLGAAKAARYVLDRDLNLFRGALWMKESNRFSNTSVFRAQKVESKTVYYSDILCETRAKIKVDSPCKVDEIQYTFAIDPFPDPTNHLAVRALVKELNGRASAWLLEKISTERNITRAITFSFLSKRTVLGSRKDRFTTTILYRVDPSRSE
ncbi:MAG: hypothetical protein J0L75_06200 [Spirochaetes bacterium]|nr:hypothetical protein [Spirochaetota bacterium]